MKFPVKFNVFWLALIFCIVSIVSAQSGRRYPSRSDFPANARFIALTFDDGPNNIYTTQILDILKERNARATFYVNPHKFDAPTMWHPSSPTAHANTIPIIKRMIAEGHDVDNHTFDHISMGGAQNYNGPPATTATAARANLMKASQAIFDVTGYWPFSFRAPFFEWGGGGNILNGLDSELNMVFVDAGLDPADFNKQAAGGRNEIANFITSPIFQGAPVPEAQINEHLDGGIILLHDCGGPRPETVAATAIIIDRLQARGFYFVTVRELAMIKQTMPIQLTGSQMWPRPNQWIPHRQAWDPQPPALWEEGWWNDWAQWSCPTPPWLRGDGDCDDPITQT
jgi:peptidoglycan/xylan/chitin deacetylase (PgdA/CDA1 family)